MAFSTMDSIQSSRLALIRHRQHPSCTTSSPPVRLKAAHSTPRAPLKPPQSFLNTMCKITVGSISRCDCFSSWREPVSPKRARRKQREGERRRVGGMNGDNTHLLFLRGSGKSFWKKDKEKEKKERSGTEKIQNTCSHVQGRKIIHRLDKALLEEQQNNCFHRLRTSHDSSTGLCV